MSETELQPDVAARLASASRHAAQTLAASQVGSADVPGSRLASTLNALAEAERHAARSTSLVAEAVSEALERVAEDGIAADSFR